jgi:hypothetical protein
LEDRHNRSFPKRFCISPHISAGSGVNLLQRNSYLCSSKFGTLVSKTTFFDFPVFPLDDEFVGYGQNERKMLILALDHENKTDLRDFLQKILSAVKYDLDKDVLLAWLNEENRPNVASLIKNSQIKSVVCFGLVPQNLGMHFEWPLYYPIILQKVTYLRADSLAAIFEERQQGGKKMSGALWKCLQELFI